MKPDETFEEFLNSKFMDLREIDGVPIIKDNYEDLFDSWLENRDVNEIMDFAEEWGQGERIKGKEYVLKGFEESIESLKKLTIIK